MKSIGTVYNHWFQKHGLNYWKHINLKSFSTREMKFHFAGANWKLWEVEEAMAACSYLFCKKLLNYFAQKHLSSV